MNPDEDGNLFILNYRCLGYRNKELDNNEQHYLWLRIGNKIDMKRKGGSNGNKLELKKFVVQFLHVGNLQRWGMQNFGC